MLLRANDYLIDRTIEMWQPRFNRALSHEDARQIVENVTGFFSILSEWSRAELAQTGNDNCKPGEADNCGESRHDR